MQYLVRGKKAKVAHIWVDGDTLCRMYSTGGMSKQGKVVRDNHGILPVCKLCLSRNTWNDNPKPKKTSRRKKDTPKTAKILDGGTYVCIGNQIIPKNWPNFDSLVAFLTQ